MMTVPGLEGLERAPRPADPVMDLRTAHSPGGGSHQAGQLNLEARRTGAGLTLEVIAERTKISMRHLRAIESEHFHLLPGGIFQISYLKQYAEAIGCGAEELLEAAGCVRRGPGGEAELAEKRLSQRSAWRRPFLLGVGRIQR